MGAWLNDPAYRERLREQPIDVLAFVRGVAAFFRDRETIEGILEGRVTSVDQL